MTGIGIGIIVVFYSFGVYGYCLVKGYDVGYLDLWKTTPTKWPPDQLPANQTFHGSSGRRSGGGSFGGGTIIQT